MTKIDIEQIKADREAGTKWPWICREVSAFPSELVHLSICGDGWILADITGPAYEFQYPNANRISRVPDMEDALIEAKAAFDAIVQRSHDDPLGSSKVIDMREIAEQFLERFK